MVRIKRLVFWLSLIGSISVTMMNLVVLFSLPDAQFLATSSFGSTLRDQFLHPGFSFIHNQQLLKQLQIQQEQQFRPRRRSRTLIGYFSMESRGDCYYRKRHRELFQIWNDTRVCSLYSLQKDPMRYSECQLVYTFVMGGTMAAVGAVNTTTPSSTTTSAADDPPTMIVNNFPFPTRPLYHPHPPILKCSDKHAKDITWLNIRYVAWLGLALVGLFVVKFSRNVLQPRYNSVQPLLTHSSHTHILALRHSCACCTTTTTTMSTVAIVKT